MSRHFQLSIAVCLGLLSLSVTSRCLGQAGVFVGCGFFDRENVGARAVQDLPGTDFDTVLIETHIAADGTIRSNKKDLFRDGQWVGGDDSKRKLTALIEGVDRVEFWFAGWGRKDYEQIREARTSEAATAALKANLRAVKELGVVGITDDDEDVYDTDLAVWFGGLVKESGLKLSISPYRHFDHWQTIANEVGIDRIYYQSYSPRRRLEGWDQLDGELWPGLNTERDTVMSAKRKFDDWAENPAVKGGFVWSFDVILNRRDADFQSYAATILAAVPPADDQGERGQVGGSSETAPAEPAPADSSQGE